MAQRYLFSGPSIFDVIQHRARVLREAFRELPDSFVENEQKAEDIVKDYELHVPTLDETRKYGTTKEVQVDVSQDEQRHIWDRSKPCMVQGTEITIHVPFEGDKWLFDIRPTSFTNPLPIGDANEEELLMAETIIEPHDPSADFQRRTEQIIRHLDWLRPSALHLKTQLQQLVKSLIAERKQRLTSQKEILGRLGIPIKQHSIQQAPSTPVITARSKEMIETASPEHERWDFFISHASEDKEEIAKPLADAFISKGLKVWYDDFSLNVGDVLIESIDRGLAGSRFGIVILSPYFFEKHWPKQELSGLATREVNGVKVILPVWHHVGVEEVRANSPTLAGRVAVSTDKGLEYVVERLLKAAGLGEFLESSRSPQEKLVFEESVYWKRTKGRREGPYCPVCYDDKHKEIHLTAGATKGTYGCGICQNNFTTKEYDPRPARRRRPYGAR